MQRFKTRPLIRFLRAALISNAGTRSSAARSQRSPILPLSASALLLGATVCSAQTLDLGTATITAASIASETQLASVTGATATPVPAFSAYATGLPAATDGAAPKTATAAASVSAPTTTPAIAASANKAAVTSAGTTTTASPPTEALASAGAARKDSPLLGVVAEIPQELPPTDLWDRIRAGYGMPELDDPLVAKWEKFYSERPEYMARIVDRSSKYLFYIVTELERRGMPLEIALLPMIESAFNPVAYSSAKAAGIWQFIPSTGVNYGMKQDWWADSRRDIVTATNGALDYLGKLHGMFGDWQLALASYNWGEGSVARAVTKSKTRGKDGSYLALDMPAETRNYLPKLQAVKNIIRNPAAYGLTIAGVPNEPYFKTITLAHPIDLKRAAQLADMNESEFVALNPAHNRPVIGGRNEYQVLLPADRADTFLARLEVNDTPRVSWMAYRTRVGDRIETLAQRFGTTAGALKSVNGIRAVAPTLPAGYNLLVPSDGPSDEALGSIQNAVFTKFPEYVAPRSHKVRRGDTFAGIAKRYGVAPATLASWNRMSKHTVRAGQVLYVSGPAPTRQSVRKGGRVVQVKQGGRAGVRATPVKGKRVAATSGKRVNKRRR